MVPIEIDERHGEATPAASTRIAVRVPHWPFDFAKVTLLVADGENVTGQTEIYELAARSQDPAYDTTFLMPPVAEGRIRWTVVAGEAVEPGQAIGEIEPAPADRGENAKPKRPRQRTVSSRTPVAHCREAAAMGSAGSDSSAG